MMTFKHTYVRDNADASQQNDTYNKDERYILSIHLVDYLLRNFEISFLENNIPHKWMNLFKILRQYFRKS